MLVKLKQAKKGTLSHKQWFVFILVPRAALSGNSEMDRPVNFDVFLLSPNAPSLTGSPGQDSLERAVKSLSSGALIATTSVYCVLAVTNCSEPPSLQFLL